MPARIIHDNQIIGADGTTTLDPATVAEELPVLIVPGLLVADDAMLTGSGPTPRRAATW